MGEDAGQVIFRVLGPVDLVTQSQWHGRLSKQTKTILALLATARETQLPTDRLVEQVWSHHPPAFGKDMIHRQIKRIRMLILDEESLIVRSGRVGYWLDRTRCEVDAESFAQLVDEGRDRYFAERPEQAAGILAQALNLWRDTEALTDVRDNIRLNEIFNNLQMQRLEAEEMLVSSYLQSQQIHKALQELARLMARYPGREPFWAQCMVAQTLDGSPADASATFSKVRRHLCDEFGLDPTPFLVRVHETILRQPSRDELLATLTTRT